MQHRAKRSIILNVGHIHAVLSCLLKLFFFIISPSLLTQDSPLKPLWRLQSYLFAGLNLESPPFWPRLLGGCAEVREILAGFVQTNLERLILEV